MTKEELRKEIERKQDLVNKLNAYLMTKGHTLPTGKDVNQSIIALEKQIRQHEYDLEHGDVLSDDEVLAIARGESYLNEDERKKEAQNRKAVRGMLGLSDEDERKEIQELIKAGY